MYQLKNDRYRRARGGKAFVVSISCAGCQTHILDYQKDGDGRLKRCYLNRILSPSHLESLQRSVDHKREIRDIAPLKCTACNTIVGTPMIHHDGRYAFRLRQGFFLKKRITE